MKKEAPGIALSRDLFFTLKNIEENIAKSMKFPDLFAYVSTRLLVINPHYTLSNILYYLNQTKHSETEEMNQQFRKRVQYLQTVPQPEQRTPEWYAFRKKRITASSVAKILHLNPYANRKSYIMDKCDRTPNADKNWFSSIYMNHGVRYEEVVNLLYQLENNTKVIEFGCIPHDTLDYIGASPDGITPDGVMVEIKCPYSRTIDGTPPIYYWCQVQLQLEVADLNACDFVEAKLLEFDDEADFLIDQDETRSNYTYRGHRKGGILEYKMNNVDDKFYNVYFDIELEPLELICQMNKEISRLESMPEVTEIKKRFWHNPLLSTTRIYRDKEWFQSVLPLLRECWDTILHIRSLDDLEYEKAIQPYRKKKRSPYKKKKKKYLFMDDDEEDSPPKPIVRNKKYPCRIFGCTQTFETVKDSRIHEIECSVNSD